MKRITILALLLLLTGTSVGCRGAMARRFKLFNRGETCTSCAAPTVDEQVYMPSMPESNCSANYAGGNGFSAEMMHPPVIQSLDGTVAPGGHEIIPPPGPAN
jgi:hypothetical protein